MKPIIVRTKEQLATAIFNHFRDSPDHLDLNHIKTSNIKDMSFLFSGLRHSCDISQWDTSNVQDMSYMFSLSLFNGDISKWNTSKVTNMRAMFTNSVFNQDISLWDTSNVQDMRDMFYRNQDSSSVSSRIPYGTHFNFNQDISRLNISSLEFSEKMFNIDNGNKFIPPWANLNKEQLQEYRANLLSNVLERNLSNKNTKDTLKIKI